MRSLRGLAVFVSAEESYVEVVTRISEVVIIAAEECRLHQAVPGDRPTHLDGVVLRCRVHDLDGDFLRRTFRVRGNRSNGHIEIRGEDGKCNHYYHYFLHEQVGLCYVRLQSWFPFTMRVGLNGREWLFRHGIDTFGDDDGRRN